MLQSRLVDPTAPILLVNLYPDPPRRHLVDGFPMQDNNRTAGRGLFLHSKDSYREHPVRSSVARFSSTLGIVKLFELRTTSWRQEILNSVQRRVLTSSRFLRLTRIQLRELQSPRGQIAPLSLSSKRYDSPRGFSTRVDDTRAYLGSV